MHSPRCGRQRCSTLGVGRRWRLAALLGAWVAGPLSARAAPAAGEPIDWRATLPPEGTGLGELPPLPEGFRRRQVGVVRWAWPAALDEEVARMQHDLPSIWKRLTTDLGTSVPMDLVVRVARGPEEMAALAPRGLSPPGYAVGVAYPAMGVVLLSAVAPRVREPVDLPTTLVHEVSHVALYRAVGGRPLPRWFVEGVAIHQAKEASLTRMRLLWQAVAFGRPLPLRVIAERVRGESSEVSLAYAQAADLVGFLRRRADDRRRFTRLVHELHGGRSFEEALSDVYAMNLAAFEAAWRQDASERFGWLPMVLGSGSFWGLASVLLVLAWWRRRRAAQERLARWDREEEAESAIHASPLDDPRWTPGAGASEQGTDQGTLGRERLLVVVRREPELPWISTIEREGARRDPDVPTVRWEGEEHTLH